MWAPGLWYIYIYIYIYIDVEIWMSIYIATDIDRCIIYICLNCVATSMDAANVASWTEGIYI